MALSTQWMMSVNNRSQGCTAFTTVDHTTDRTTAVLGLQQLWPDAKSNKY